MQGLFFLRLLFLSVGFCVCVYLCQREQKRTHAYEVEINVLSACRTQIMYVNSRALRAERPSERVA